MGVSGEAPGAAELSESARKSTKKAGGSIAKRKAAAALVRDGVSVSLSSVAPLRIPNGTGSPVNPIAMF
jgi:hypothetical protein